MTTSIKTKYYDNLLTFMQNSLENVFPKSIAVQFMVQTSIAEIQEKVDAFTELMKNSSDVILETEKFLKSREAHPLTKRDIDLNILKDVLTADVYKNICDVAYTEGKPIISDEEYDYLFGNNATAMLQPVGQVVALPVWMGSLNKVKSEKEFNAWIKKVGINTKYVVISPKIDGVSALASSNHMYSRGSGNIGSSLDNILPYIKKEYNNPIDYTVYDYIRGELVMPKTTFNDKYSSTFKNARNLVAGQLSKRNIDKNILKDIYFVPYEWIDSTFKNRYPSEQLQYMHGDQGVINSSGFIWYKIETSTLKYDYLNDLLNSWSLSLPYDIDGLVIVPDLRYYSIQSGNPALNIAFKKSTSAEESANVKVLKVEWQISKYGAYKPVVYIEPTLLDGATITKVSGHNASTILEKQIGPGAIIKIVRSGKVIPYIVEVLIPSRNVVVPDGIWKKKDLYKKLSENKKINSIQQIKGLTDLFQKLGVKNINEQTITRLYSKCKLIRFLDFINATPESISAAFPLGGKQNSNIIEELHKLKNKKIQAHILVSAAGVLGQGIGEQKTEKFLSNFGYQTRPKIEDIMKVEGFGKATATQIHEKFNDMKDFIEKCINNGLTVVVYYKNKNRPIICLSGFRDAILEKKFEVKNTVTKDVQYLVVLDPDKITEKIKKAQEYGIKIITRDHLYEQFLSD